ncbi:MAG: hypothetical protein HYU80_00605 [Candidatus Blackburnbacteria bacterium]|nr:hypothetical protein [Candidatus Blackburnbacteria bacterium]
MIDFNKLQESAGLKPELNSLGSIVSAFVPYLFGIAGIILFLYLIWGGFGIMTAQGDPKGTAAARERITHAIIGFVIIFAAFWLVQILGLVLGVKQFGNLFQ